MKLVIGVAVLTLLSCVAATWIAGSILTAAAPQTVGQIPSDLKGTNVEFRSSSGALIHGWFIPGEPGKGAVILMHGVRSNRLSVLDRARFLSRAGFSVLLFDFQAHGDSSGERITFGYLESRDAQSAVNFLKQSRPGERIGIVGISMGGAATILATPPLPVDAIVLEMVYPTIEEAVGDRLAIRLGQWSKHFTSLLTWQLKLRINVSTADLRPIDRIGTVNAPKLFIVGSEDQHTTLAESRRLFESAPAPKELWIVEGASHTDLHRVMPLEYESRVTHFFQNYLVR